MVSITNTLSSERPVMSNEDGPSRRRFLQTLGVGGVVLSGYGIYQASTEDDERETEDDTTMSQDRNEHIITDTERIEGVDNENSGNNQTPDVVRDGIEFDRVVNAVDDLGMDPSGETAVNTEIEEAGDGTLIQFPDGEYLFEQVTNGVTLHNQTRGFEGIGDDVRFVAPPNYNTFLLSGDGMPAAYFADIDIDQSTPQTCAGLRLLASRTIIQNVEVIGRSDQFGSGTTFLTVSNPDPNGLTLIENVTKTKGHWSAYNGSSGQIGIFVGSNHEGVLEVRNCDLREFPNNAMYTSRCPGDVRVYDSYFENNNVSAVRIGGEGSFVENCEIVVDPSQYEGPRDDDFEDEAFFFRGVFIEEHFSPETGVEEQKPAGAAVRNTSFRYKNNPTGAPAINIRSHGRSLSVSNCTIEYDNDNATSVINREDNSPGNHPAGDPPRWLRMQSSEITGNGDVDEVIHLEDADRSIIDSCTIRNMSSDTTGVRILRSSDCLISDTTISVIGPAVSAEDSGVVQTNITGNRNNDSGAT
jgi:hypothetical protein